MQVQTLGDQFSLHRVSKGVALTAVEQTILIALVSHQLAPSLAGNCGSVSISQVSDYIAFALQLPVDTQHPLAILIDPFSEVLVLPWISRSRCGLKSFQLDDRGYASVSLSLFSHSCWFAGSGSSLFFLHPLSCSS